MILKSTKMFTWKRPEAVESQVWHTFQKENPANCKIEEFIVQDLAAEKFDNAIEHLLEHFLDDEPICRSKNVKANAAALKEICDLWRMILKQNIVLACFKKDTAELVGLNMVCVCTREDLENYKLDIERLKDNVWKAVHDVALSKFDVFKKYKTIDKVLIAYGLSVSKNFRRRGIATEILRARIPLCKALNIPLSSTVFTAIGSQIPAEKIGFKVDYEISYEELASLNDEFKFNNLGTDSLKVMSLVIEN
jgi:GNAT superfamily N-acetyltransferase